MSLREARRDGLPQRMVEAGELVCLQVEGVRTPFYAHPDAPKVLRAAEKVPPDDQAKWCRDALAKVWGFSCSWEVHKKPEQLRYGYYVLPVLHGGRFVARFDGRYDAKARTLHVLGYWTEDGGLPLRHPRIRDAFGRFLEYLGGKKIAWPARRRAAALSGRGSVVAAGFMPEGSSVRSSVVGQAARGRRSQTCRLPADYLRRYSIAEQASDTRSDATETARRAALLAIVGESFRHRSASRR